MCFRCFDYQLILIVIFLPGTNYKVTTLKKENNIIIIINLLSQTICIIQAHFSKML